MSGQLSDVTFAAALEAELAAGRPVGLASLLAARGSMPRREGSRLAVLADGTFLGTVGGGRIEQIAIERAHELVSDPESRARLEWETHAKTGMACGGDALLATRRLDGRDRAALSALLGLLRAHKAGWVVEDWHDASAPELRVVSAEGTDAPSEPLPDVVVFDEQTARLTEPVGPDPVCYVFGGGHVGQALVGVLASVGFRVVVYDDRPETALPERFPAAERVVCGDFRSLTDQVGVTARDYVVILTHGHAADIDVLERVLPTRPAYVGCIGSRAKAALARKVLISRELPETHVDAIRLPIGDKIGAVTPAEIAVSIAAEMIRCRAERRPHVVHVPSEPRIE